MISVSSNPITTTISSEEFQLRFKDVNYIAPLFQCKPVKHLTVGNNKLAFILKRVAQFEFSASKDTSNSWIQFDSTNIMLFKSAIRFSLNIESQEVVIDFETDTNVFMELFLEKRMVKLLEYLADNLQQQLKQCL